MSSESEGEESKPVPAGDPSLTKDQRFWLAMILIPPPAILGIRILIGETATKDFLYHPIGRIALLATTLAIILGFLACNAWLRSSNRGIPVGEDRREAGKTILKGSTFSAFYTLILTIGYMVTILGPSVLTWIRAAEEILRMG